ncbi:hypothetical protein HPB50_014524 [Hyalomma asiaticum]|uniref:Uncharacterized protein n=1 Tax=Hyalomma asiaticum TaxID=266040 RepID=A0ACB7SYC8_HYAAI|nr:hypothetical protein HPB50_014524 [Hyalomma asiaticum]
MKKPVPSSYDLKNALKIVSVSQFLKVPKTSGYDIDESAYLVDFLSGEIQQVKSTGEPEDSEYCNDENVDLQPVCSIEGDILAHLAGFLLKPIVSAVEKCGDCTEMLLAKRSKNEHGLTQLKEYVKGGNNLIYAGQDVLDVVVQCESVFKHICETEDLSLLKQPMKTFKAAVSKHVDVPQISCARHPDVTDKLLSRFVSVRLRIYTRWLNTPEQPDKSYGSKTVVGANLER